MEHKNITLIKNLLNEYKNDNFQGYLDGCHENFYGKIWSGLIPGGEEINGKAEFIKCMDEMIKLVEIKKFEPVNWAAVDDTVYFTVNWEFIWKKTNKLVKTSANVRKVIKDGKIREKYHIINNYDVENTGELIDEKDNTGKFNEHTPFILLARIKVKPDKINEYLELAEKTDKKVQELEAGMLHHTFDNDQSQGENYFCWSELYRNDKAFLDHLENPFVKTYLEKHAELGLNFEVEVYGTVSDNTKEIMLSLGLPIKFFDSKLGYSRCY